MSFMISPDRRQAGEHLEVRDLEGLAERVTRLERLYTGSFAAPGEPSDRALAALATTLARVRQRRARYLPADLFAEPGWDMLLDLFASRVHGLRVGTTSLCLAGNAPQATGLRYIAQLEGAGLLRRAAAPEDKRLVLNEITSKGFAQMRQCLGELARQLDATGSRVE